MKTERYRRLIFIFLWSLVPVIWFYGALYLDRFHFETNYRAGLLIAYMLAMISWGVVGGFSRKKSSVPVIQNAFPIAILSFFLFFSFGFYSNYMDSLYYVPDTQFFPMRLYGSFSTGTQFGMFFIAAPFLLGYIPGRIAAMVYSWLRNKSNEK